MTELLTAAQMRAIEKAAIDSGVVTGLDLMERAGRGVVDAIFAEWPDLAEGPHRVVVLCGPGNNGGDGFVVARLLKARGWEVAAYLFGHAAKLPPDARVNHDRWMDLGDCGALGDDAALASFYARVFEFMPEVIVDAMIGTGLKRPLPGALAAIASDVAGALQPNWQVARVVAVDIPSGIDSDTGAVVGEVAVRADLTVSFHRRKHGHVDGAGPEYCGKVVVKDIGL